MFIQAYAFGLTKNPRGGYAFEVWLGHLLEP